MPAQPRHHSDRYRIAVAHVAGTTSRWAKRNRWHGPAAEDMGEALAEILECAHEAGDRWLDVLTEQAGIMLGAARARQVSSPLAQRRADLILAAVASTGHQVDESALEAWAVEGLKRMTSDGLARYR